MLGFFRGLDYYDDKETLTYFEPLITESIAKQMSFPHLHRKIATVGQGKNLAYLEKLNKKHDFFETIEVLPHPRWVMQYRRKEKEKYIGHYLDVLNHLKD